MRKEIKIGDCPQQHLRIRNWEEFQQDHKGRLREGVPSPWIKDYTEKSQDDAYARMSPTERYVLDECRRQRGRKGKNLQRVELVFHSRLYTRAPYNESNASAPTAIVMPSTLPRAITLQSGASVSQIAPRQHIVQPTRFLTQPRMKR